MSELPGIVARRTVSPTRQDCLPTPLYLIRIAYLLGRIPARFASALGMAVGEEPGAGAVDRRMMVPGGLNFSRRTPVAVGSRDRMSMTRLPAGLSRCGGSMWGSHVPGTSGRRPAGLTFASLLPCVRSIGSSSGELERVALQGHSSR